MVIGGSSHIKAYEANVCLEGYENGCVTVCAGPCDLPTIQTDRRCLPGKLQPLPIPSRAWKIKSMNFVEGLPLSSFHNCILVVVDSFTKNAHFLPLKHPFTAIGVAKLFLDNIYKLHGMPHSIIFVRDKIFLSLFWKELFALSNGQTKRLNQTMETFLRCFVNACPSKWKAWLSLAEYWYNCCFHSAVGHSPFEALYGYTPKTFWLI